MPHDCFGQELHEGDIVLVPCRVKNVQQHNEFCNVNLETTRNMFPGDYKSSLVLNSTQVVKGVLSCETA